MLRDCEKATKFKKNLPPVLKKQSFLTRSVKTSGIFFQIFVAFSEKLDLKEYYYGSIQLRFIHSDWKLIIPFGYFKVDEKGSFVFYIVCIGIR